VSGTLYFRPPPPAALACLGGAPPGPMVAQLWDTAGQEIYADMCKIYYRGSAPWPWGGGVR